MPEHQMTLQDGTCSRCGEPLGRVCVLDRATGEQSHCGCGMAEVLVACETKGRRKR